MGRSKYVETMRMTAGVRSDFEQLLQKFTDTETVRYENFAAIWRDMKMTFLFAARINDREAREFTEDCFQIALQYYLPPYNFQVRVGGLYLLYGLYTTQPLVFKAKIRITPEQWENIVEFQNEAHRQEHLDVDYVFHKMRIMRAFDFCATPMEIFPSERPWAQDETTESDQFKEEQSVLYDLFSTDVLEQMAAVHQHYHRVKVSMEGSDASKPSKSLDVIQGELVPTVTKAIVHYQTKRKAANAKKHGGATTDEDDDENDPDYNIYSTIDDSKGRSKRKRIKAKAYSKVVETKQSRRKRVREKTEPTDTDTEEVTSPQKRKKKTVRVGMYEADDASQAYSASLQGKDSENTSDTTLLSMPMLEAEQEAEKSPKKGKSSRGKKSPQKTKPTEGSGDEKANITQSKGKNSKGDKSKSTKTTGKEEKVKDEGVSDTDATEKEKESPKVGTKGRMSKRVMPKVVPLLAQDDPRKGGPSKSERKKR